MITMNNRTNAQYAAQFNNLTQEVFGISIAGDEWLDNYESYSIIENDVMLANVCIFKHDMIIQSNKVRAHQFGAVATRKSARGKGYARQLMEHVLSQYPTTPAFLHANENVTEFYPLFGFKKATTYRAVLDVNLNNAHLEKIHIDMESERLEEMLSGVRMHSCMVDDTNTADINMFNLYGYAKHLYLLPQCDAIVVAKQHQDTLFLADVITAKPCTISELLKALPFCAKHIEFGFCPDWLDITPHWIKDEDALTYIKGTWNLPKYFRFPCLSET